MKLINSDCISAMKEMPDNSVDSIVTDPPYELGFMGKSWDASGIAFNIEVWQEALRVLKPGGHLIAFSGSRTYHRMAVAIEDAGFEIRDQIMWVYGSGFPKSHNVSKGIDKAAGAEREVIGEKISPDGIPYSSRRINQSGPSVGGNAYGDYGNAGNDITAPATPAAKQWDGWGTALKPAHEPMVLARKPLIGTVANNVLTYGTGGLNIDGSRVSGEGYTQGGQNNSIAFGNNLEKQPRNDGSQGRWPANFIHDGSDEVVALFPTNAGAAAPVKSGFSGESNGIYSDYASKGDDGATFYGDSGSAARFFYCAKASKRDRNEGLDGFAPIRKVFMATKNGTGEPSKGLERFTTEPSANFHPTVKPTDLMRYLCRLVTPPNGIVLDPFMGSGSTGKAAMLESFDFIGIEQDSNYIKIAEARIEYTRGQSEQQLF